MIYFFQTYYIFLGTHNAHKNTVRPHSVDNGGTRGMHYDGSIKTQICIASDTRALTTTKM